MSPQDGTPGKQRSGAKADLLLPVFISGACVMAVELGASRIIAPYLGTTIYTWAAVIGLVMAALSAGYYVGGDLAERYNDRKQLSRIFLLAAFCTVLVPLFARLIVPVTILIPLAWASLVSAMVVVPASFFYGMVSPYAIKLMSQDRESGRSSGAIFAFSTLGSIAGTLITGFILIPNVGVTSIFIGAAALMLVAAWLAGRGLNVMSIPLFMAAAACASLVSFSPIVSGTMIYQATSEYYTISVFDNATLSDSTGRVLVLDDAYSTGENPLNGSPLFDYVIDTRGAYQVVKNPSRALVLGVAGGTEIENLKNDYPDITVDGVDVDAKAVDVGFKYFSLRQDNRTNIVIDDGRRYVTTTDKRYDIVLLDVFRGRSPPPHMASVEFVRELKSVMNPGGVVVVNIISSVQGDKSALLQLMYNTYGQAFSHVAVVPVGNDTDKVQNVILMASDSDLSSYSQSHPGRVYDFKPSTTQVITDELNPVDLLVQ